MENFKIFWQKFSEAFFSKLVSVCFLYFFMYFYSFFQQKILNQPFSDQRGASPHVSLTKNTIDGANR